MVPFIACRMTDEREQPNLKTALWGLSTVSMGLTLSPMGFLGGPLLMRAAMGTGLIYFFKILFDDCSCGDSL